MIRVCAGCGHGFAVPVKRPRQRYCALSCVPRGGRANPRYNGGLSFNRRLGRWVIVCRDGSLMYYSRGVVAAELGRLLRDDELVHHRNGDATDDRAENLQVVSRSEHFRMHEPEILAAGRAWRATA